MQTYTIKDVHQKGIECGRRLVSFNYDSIPEYAELLQQVEMGEKIDENLLDT